MRTAAVVLLVLVGAGLAVYAADRFEQPARVIALRDTVRLTDSVEVVRWDTVRIYQPRADAAKARSDSLDQAIGVVDDSTLHVQHMPDSIRDTVVVVPAPVVADLRALRATVATQDTLIHALYQHDTTQQWRLASRDKLIATLRPPESPWGIGATCGVDPFSRSARCAIGVTYRVGLHRLSLPFFR